VADPVQDWDGALSLNWYGALGVDGLFPPISPLQLLLLCPNLPQALHYLEMLALLLVGSLGSLTLFFLGLPGGLL